MSPGEVFLANFPFGDSAGMKLRPVLLLTGPLGTVPEILVAYISSVIPTALLPTDIVLDPVDPKLASTKLKIKSVLRLHKLATIHQRSLARQLGNISATVQQEVDDLLRDLLNL
jgi:mRNA interferase MazF